jgi:hypothetical protein
MQEQQTPFQDRRAFFREVALPVLAQSPEYSGCSKELDSLLLLGDRVLAACRGHASHDRVLGIGERLCRAANDLTEHSKTLPGACDLLQGIEIWLKAVLWLARPQCYVELVKLHARREDALKELRQKKDELTREVSRELHKQTEKQFEFNLYRVIEELGLLTHDQLELAIETLDEVEDPVRRLVLCAKEYRNPVVHDGKPIRAETRQDLLRAGPVTLLAALCRHADAVRASLRGLVTRPLVLGDLEPLAKTVESERQDHLRRFVGRLEWLKEMRELLGDPQQAAGGYILLTGPQGMGKSALLAKLTEELAVPEGVGTSRGDVQRAAPWLPGVVLHFGKMSKNRFAIGTFLLAQINVLLLRPVELPAEVTRSADDFALLSRRGAQMSGPLHGPPTGSPPPASRCPPWGKKNTWVIRS